MKLLMRLLMALVIGLSLSSAAGAGELSAPSDLSLRIEGKGFLLTWKSSSDDPGTVTGYVIERSSAATGPFKVIARVKKGVQKYSDRTAKAETIHYYRVRAVTGKESSAYSNTVTGELPGS